MHLDGFRRASDHAEWHMGLGKSIQWANKNVDIIPLITRLLSNNVFFNDRLQILTAA